MAQKEYIIKLSPVTAKTKFYSQNFEPVLVSTRNMEINALDTLISLASQGKEKTPEFNICTDLIRQLENLEDSENSWVITQGDYNLIMEGFAESAKPNQRPTFFSKLKDLFDQLEKPTPKTKDTKK